MEVDKIKEIIEESGHDLHFRIADSLSAQGWNVQVSPYYNDPVKNIPREIDIVAIKTHTIGNGIDPLVYRLFIECKYIKGDNVIWFRKKDREKATLLAKDNEILRDQEDHYLEDQSFRPPKAHHYLKDDQVMKLSSKKGDKDPFYDGMNGSLHALLFYQESQYTSYAIDLPMIVVDSFNNLHRRDGSNPEGHTAITDNFQMEVDYIYINRQEKPVARYFLIDVVNESTLIDFLEMVESSEANVLKRLISFQAQQRKNNQMFDGGPLVDMY